MNRLIKGQRARRTARDHNEVAAAVDLVKRGVQVGPRQPDVSRAGGEIRVRNVSGGDCNIFDVMVVTGVVTDPSVNLPEFQFRLVLEIDTPADDEDQAFVILQEPIKDNGIGRAVIAGRSVCSIIRPSGNTDDFAGVVSGNSTLTCGKAGALILWEDTFVGTAAHLAVVKFPHSTGKAGDVVSVVASGTTLASPLDGTTLSSGDLVLKTNATAGVYKYNGSTFAIDSTPPVVAVRKGTARGRQMFYLISTTYSAGRAVFQ